MAPKKKMKMKTKKKLAKKAKKASTTSKSNLVLVNFKIHKREKGTIRANAKRRGYESVSAYMRDVSLNPTSLKKAPKKTLPKAA